MAHNMFDFSHFPQLETERLLLREMQPHDVSSLLRLFGNPEVVRFIEMQPIKTHEQADEWMKWMGGFFSAKDGLRWGIVSHEDMDTLIGSAGLHNWNREAHYAKIGCEIAYSHWSNGYATEVLTKLVEFGWNYMKLNRIEADIIAGNTSSMRVMEKLGFRHEGTLRQRVLKGGKYYDVNIYGLLRCDYTGNCD